MGCIVLFFLTTLKIFFFFQKHKMGQVKNIQSVLRFHCFYANCVTLCPQTDVQMFVCNREIYGYIPVPLRAHNTLQDENESFMHCLLEVNSE